MSDNDGVDEFDRSDVVTPPLTIALLKIEVEQCRERIDRLEREAFNGMLELRRLINDLATCLAKDR